MALTPQGEQFLRRCADDAIAELEEGTPTDALAVVVSEFAKSELTSNIDLMLVIMIVTPAAQRGRDALEKAVMGFNV